MNIAIDISHVILKTDRLILRPFNMGDLNDFFAYATVKGVGELAGWSHHEDINESKAVLISYIKGKRTLALEYQGRVIGSLEFDDYDEKMLSELSPYACVELGCVLSKEYWGHDFMMEATTAVIDYCFNALNIDVIIGSHLSYNYQSLRLQEKLGFIHYKQFAYYNEELNIRNHAWITLLFNDKNIRKEILSSIYETQTGKAKS